MSSVLDASAILAWLRDEPGADQVTHLLPDGSVSAVNWSEVWQKLAQRSVDADRVTARLRTLGLRVEPVTEADGVEAARLWAATRHVGLSLGDRCCLALAARLDVDAVTADSAWAGLDLGISITMIRERE